MTENPSPECLDEPNLKVKWYRLKKHLKQKEVADTLGNSITTYMDIAKFFYNYIDGEYQVPKFVNGSDYDEENDCCRDIFQYYIISRNGYEFLSNYTDEVVYYLPSLDIYV